jgi:transcriptional regulator with XRE-family HTH domain
MSQITMTLPELRFGALLRQWRTSRKLSQLELALESAVSQRHLSFLESGRARPSQQMVLQLAEVLEVPLRERNSLLTAAGFAPFYRERGLSEQDMAPVQDALTRMLAHHDPYPAVVVDRDYDVLLENRGFTAMLALFGEPAAVWAACCPDGRPNLLRLVFHNAGARPFIRNFDEVGPFMLQRLYRELAAAKNDKALAFIEELRKDPSIPAQWMTANASLGAAPPLVPLVMGHDALELRLISMISTFGTPYDITTDEIRVETFCPEDAATEALLKQLSS